MAATGRPTLKTIIKGAARPSNDDPVSHLSEEQVEKARKIIRALDTFAKGAPRVSKTLLTKGNKESLGWFTIVKNLEHQAASAAEGLSRCLGIEVDEA